MAKKTVKRRTPVEADDTLTLAEALLVKKAEREMKQGRFVTLAQLHHEGRQEDALPFLSPLLRHEGDT